MEYRFPKDFLWGTAFSAFQTEMGISEEAVSRNSDWYLWTHSDAIRKRGLVTTDLPEDGPGFWDLYKEDLKLARGMNNNTVRMNIEWPRIFPKSTGEVPAALDVNDKGDITRVSVDGEGFRRLSELADWNVVNHYKDIIDYAKSLGLSVFLTLWHFSLPSWFHDPIECYQDIENAKRRGWLDRKNVAEFGKYAYFAAKTLGDRVELWETMNEPWVQASAGFLYGVSPPGISDFRMMMDVQRNLVYAHTVAYKNIKTVLPDKPVGVGVDPQYLVPVDSRPMNVRAAENAKYLENDEWWLDAAMFGQFDMDCDRVAEERRMNEVSGSDFIGIDYYRRQKVSYDDRADLPEILRVKYEPCEDCSDMGWDIFPEGIRTVCGDIYRRYGVPIYILENGMADESDQKRTRYLVEHLKNLSLAINEDGTPVRGYYHWSLTDNFEWAEGFAKRFGLYRVDYETKARIPTKAVEVYRKICKDNSVPSAL